MDRLHLLELTFMPLEGRLSGERSVKERHFDFDTVRHAERRERSNLNSRRLAY